MFVRNQFNRSLYDVASDGTSVAGGGTSNTGGEIILSGMTDDSSARAKGSAGTGAGVGTGTGVRTNVGNPDAKTAEEIEVEKAAAASAGTATQGAADTLIAIPDNVDILIKDTLSEKYSDLSTIRFNNKGDVVNVEGTVLITKADLDTNVAALKTARTAKADEYIKSLKTIVIADDNGAEVEHTISEDGSVKDKDGKIIYTADQLREQIMSTDDYLADKEEPVSLYDEVEAISGLQLVDENGEPVIFEETAEGLARRDIHIAKQEGTRIANEQLSAFFNNNPELEDAFFYLKANGNLNGFGVQTNHEGVSIDDANEQQHLDIIIESEMMRGLSKEAAIKRANMFKSNDMALEEAKAGLAFMQNKEKQDKQANIDAFNAKQQEIIREQTEYWNNVANILKTGRVLDYTIPDNIRVPQDNGTIVYKSKDDFYNYMYQPVENGLTAAQLDAQNEPIEVKIFNDFLRFVGNDTSYIVSQKVKRDKVETFKKRFTNGGIPSKRVIIKPPTKKSNNDNIVM